MFSDSLLQSTGHARRSWVTVLSFFMESIAIAVLVLVPLIGSVALPTIKSTIVNIPFGRPDAPPAAKSQRQTGRAMRVVVEDALRLHVPSRIPQGIKPDRPSEAAQQAAPPGIGT